MFVNVRSPLSEFDVGSFPAGIDSISAIFLSILFIIFDHLVPFCLVKFNSLVPILGKNWFNFRCFFLCQFQRFFLFLLTLTNFFANLAIFPHFWYGFWHFSFTSFTNFRSFDCSKFWCLLSICSRFSVLAILLSFNVDWTCHFCHFCRRTNSSFKIFGQF